MMLWRNGPRFREIRLCVSGVHDHQRESRDEDLGPILAD